MSGVPVVRLLTVALGIAAGACSSATQEPGGASPRADSGAFVVTLGNDTVAVERYVRTADRVVSEAITRTGRTQVQRALTEFAPDGSLRRYELTTAPGSAPADAPPSNRRIVTVDVDSVTIAITQGDSTRTRKVPTRPGLLPLLVPLYSTYESVAMRAVRAGGDSTVIIVLSGGTYVPFIVQRFGADSILFRNPEFGTWRARIDPQGRILGFSGRGSTFQVEVQRVPWLEIAPLARSFALRDPQGNAPSTLSPRDTVTASVGGANLWVDYGRPYARGRTIFGDLVPWNQVWRTGANAATQFRTDRELVIGGVSIPPGTYTLWTLPSPSGWKLIVNKQTGQWGTAYDPAQDLARIDVSTTSLPQLVEQFRIRIEPEADGGVMHLDWERTRVVVPFGVR